VAVRQVIGDWSWSYLSIVHLEFKVLGMVDIVEGRFLIEIYVHRTEVSSIFICILIVLEFLLFGDYVFLA
jgi:hypothetical protein